MLSVNEWAAKGGAEGPQAQPSRISWWTDLCFLLAAFVFLYLILFVLPGTPIYLGGDGDIFLANAKRMLEGEVIYRDFAQFTFPGTEVVNLLLFKVLGPRPWIGNAMLLVLGLGLTWLTLMISRKLMRGWFSFLPALLFLTLIFRYNLDASHHWYGVLAVMAAVAVVLEERTLARLALAGALCGLAAWFTHSRGLLAVLGFAVFLGWEYREKKFEQGWLPRGMGALIGSLLVTVVTLNAYFVWQVGLQRFLESTVIFGVKYYSADSAWNTWRIYLHNMPNISSWQGIPLLAFLFFVHALVPFEYVAFQICYRRDARRQSWQPWDRLMLLQAIGICTFLGVAPAPGYWRLSAVALPAVILFVWALTSGGWVGKSVLRALAAGALALMIAFPVRTQTHRWICLDLPAGHAAFHPSECALLRWVLEHTRPPEYFFDAHSFGGMPFLAGLRIPGPVEFVTSTDYTRPEQVHQLVEALEKHRVRFIVWSPYIDFPGDAGPAGDHLGPLRAYLHQHYRLVKTFNRLDQVWERGDSVSR